MFNRQQRTRALILLHSIQTLTGIKIPSIILNRPGITERVCSLKHFLDLTENDINKFIHKGPVYTKLLIDMQTRLRALLPADALDDVELKTQLFRFTHRGTTDILAAGSIEFNHVLVLNNPELAEYYEVIELLPGEKTTYRYYDSIAAGAHFRRYMGDKVFDILQPD